MLCGLCLTGATVADNVLPPPGGGVPEVDVLGNVRQMLEGAHQPSSAPAMATPAVPAPAEPEPAPANIPSPAGQTAATPTKPAPARARPRPVPVPEKEITIQGIEDIRELSRQLDEAKRRQQGQ